jgi:hypothetical protein
MPPSEIFLVLSSIRRAVARIVGEEAERLAVRIIQPAPLAPATEVRQQVLWEEGQPPSLTAQRLLARARANQPVVPVRIVR